MHMLRYMPFLLLCFLISLFFVDNIESGGESDHISEESFFESKNPHLNHDISGKKLNGSEDLTAFENFLLDLGNRPLYFVSKTNMDTTGDGKNELVISEVRVNGNSCLIRNSIEKDGKIIWDDEFTLNDDHVKTLFGKEEYADGLLPYSLFYMGLKYSRFTEKLPNDGLLNNRISRLSRIHFKNKNTTPTGRFSLTRCLENYSGVYVFDLNMANPGIHVWEDISGSFVKLVDSQMKAS